MPIFDLKLYGMVHIRQLLRALEDYDGWRLNQRPPRIEGRGYLVDILQAPGLPDMFVVECSGSDRVTIWLAEFSIEEIETLPDK